jgi:hypothetical protein
MKPNMSHIDQREGKKEKDILFFEPKRKRYTDTIKKQ